MLASHAMQATCMHVAASQVEFADLNLSSSPAGPMGMKKFRPCVSTCGG